MNKYSHQLFLLEELDADISNYQRLIKEETERKNKVEYKLYGSPDSPFYGLKYPSQTKIINYIGDEYNVCGDLLEKIQKILVKKDMDDVLHKYTQSRLCRILNYPLCDRFNEWYELMPHTTHYTKYDVRVIPSRIFDDRYWFGSMASSSCLLGFFGGIAHRLTLKNKADDNYVQSKITKNDLIKILEKFNTPRLLSSAVNYNKSMSKKELYDIVVRNTYTLNDYEKYMMKGVIRPMWTPTN